MQIKIISAGAGSGKTHRLTQEMCNLLSVGAIRAKGIIATTFTNMAAAELQERVRITLLQKGETVAADELSNALIGTIHSLGTKLLQRFAFEAGVSPEVTVMADDDQQFIFNNALSNILEEDLVNEMEALSERLGFNKTGFSKLDWRTHVQDITQQARLNNFAEADLVHSKQQSIESLLTIFGTPSSNDADWWQQQLNIHLHQALNAINENSADTTKVTADAKLVLQQAIQEVESQKYLAWHQWAKLSKLETSTKSKELVSDLKEFTENVIKHPTLHSDIETYITRIFEIVTTAISEYEQYKKLRGIIDYTDMEVSINKLLDDPAVQAVLSQEIDLLLVDEFQDTSPIQLEIFLKLSRLANQSIWVGDPKQSIYGFRGAEPKLMHSIVQALGGIKPEDILTHSYRSRADLVFAANAIFCKAFDELPNELIALQPANEKISDPYDSSEALIHWHYEFADKGKITKEWMDNCIAQSIYQLLQKPFVFKPKNSNTSRTLLPGDIAILCRTNTNCADMAAALNRFGIKASLSRNGLVKTIECRLILACLKYILDKNDSLSVAEILYLAEHQTMQHILDDRLQFLATDVPESRWATDSPLIKKLNELRPKMVELSGSEILNLIIERLNLSNIIVSYGSATQRLGNVDQLKKIANQYEENCNRLQSAASLGGFLLWLETLHTTEKDLQAINTTADAVHIATYHKSKGLEYPLVVCHQLDGQLKDDVWGVAVVDDREQIDLDAILAHRWVRLWINPFANLIKNTLLEEKISQSPQQATATAKAKAEEARLLYVGITRARDYLVFPTYKTPTRWLNRVYQNSDEIPSLDEHTTDTVWSWNGVFLDKQTAILEQPKDFELPESAATETVMYWG